jgi:hypothetical protein
MSDNEPVDETDDEKPKDLREFIKNLAAPVMETFDSKIREHIDSRMEAQSSPDLTDRLSLLERAVADLDRDVRELQRRLDED